QNQSQWTKEEHDRFLQALKKYLPSGALAKKVSEFVGTRTPLQVRSHAQKYFLRLNKNR
ncbi:hypothetical protein GUITHDRAFT_44946, partial [Guillardia theta CCMP2712]